MIKVIRGKRSTHSIMSNSGFGPVVIIQEGVKKMTMEQLRNITVADAIKSYENGLAITTA